MRIHVPVAAVRALDRHSFICGRRPHCVHFGLVCRAPWLPTASQLIPLVAIVALQSTTTAMHLRKRTLCTYTGYRKTRRHQPLMYQRNHVQPPEAGPGRGGGGGARYLRLCSDGLCATFAYKPHRAPWRQLKCEISLPCDANARGVQDHTSRGDCRTACSETQHCRIVSWDYCAIASSLDPFEHFTRSSQLRTL